MRSELCRQFIRQGVLAIEKLGWPAVGAFVSGYLTFAPDEEAFQQYLERRRGESVNAAQ